MSITNGTHTMRNMLLALAALGVVTLSTAVIADDGTAPSVLQQTAEVVAPVAQPEPMSANDEVATIEDATEIVEPAKAHHHRHHYRRPAKQQNVFQRLMEIEKRKNAWLKRTFFGR